MMADTTLPKSTAVTITPVVIHPCRRMSRLAFWISIISKCSVAGQRGQLKMTHYRKVHFEPC